MRPRWLLRRTCLIHRRAAEGTRFQVRHYRDARHRRRRCRGTHRGAFHLLSRPVHRSSSGNRQRSRGHALRVSVIRTRHGNLIIVRVARLMPLSLVRSRRLRLLVTGCRLSLRRHLSTLIRRTRGLCLWLRIDPGHAVLLRKIARSFCPEGGTTASPSSRNTRNREHHHKRDNTNRKRSS